MQILLNICKENVIFIRLALQSLIMFRKVKPTLGPDMSGNIIQLDEKITLKLKFISERMASHDTVIFRIKM